MNFSDWPVRSFAVTRLRLDPENPRLATSMKRPTQAELIAELLKHEDVVDLAKNISHQGYFPNENLVAVKEGSNVIVLEGNRRLAALKLLLNPELAPAEYAKKIRPCAERVKQKTEKVSVVIAPNRTAVVPLIIARHKGESVKSWTTVMQARYLQSRVEAGCSVDEVVRESGLDRAEVLASLRDSKLYDVIRSLPLPQDIQQIVEDPRSFSFTTLVRIIDYKSVQDAMGYKDDEKYGFVISGKGERFQKMLAKIVSDIATKQMTSRSINTGDDVATYLREMENSFGKLKDSKSKEKTKADDLVDPAKLMPARAPAAAKARSVKARVIPIGLIPKNFRVDVQDDRILALVEELKTLRVTQYKNAVAVTFRSLIDMALTKYMSDEGHLKTCIANLSKKQPKPPDWVPSLNQQINFLLATSTIPLGPEARKALSKFTTDTSHSLTLDVLNWFTHIRYISPTAEQLRAFWTNLTPLMEMTLQKKLP